ncbi:MAG: DUF4159 domain-containing protein [Sphingobacteriales bacterium]|nr:MAG: DUF4159 domain-containing protein [Sphingobacteriales bacterium]
MKKIIYFLVLIILSATLFAQQKSTVKIGLLKYKGGGDWYANPTSLPNLAKFCNQNLGTSINTKIDEVEPSSSEIFNYTYLHITGHGNVIFTPNEANNLRNYLAAGGFLHISDNYGIDKYIRKAMKLVFPELDFVLVPFNHPIYHQKYKFPNGLPKIHEHDNKPAQGFGLFWQGKLVCFYDYETDLGDGWEDIEVHNDTVEQHTKALQMGANIIQYLCIY